MNITTIGMWTILAAVLAVPVSAAPRKGERYPIAQFTLKNGLRVVLSEDHSAPVVGLALIYDVGSRNEQKGRTGFAHLFEHMMFQGSAHVGKFEHARFIESNGGTMNGFTQSETTTYIETVPAEKLPLILWLEADRMRSLAVTAENLKNQQEVVKEEKRMRYDNQPYTSARIARLPELAYQNFVNQHTTIGSMEDLDAASLQDVQQFFRTYYAPNNAVLALVGDFSVKSARTLVLRYFGDIPRQPAPPRPDTAEPPQTAERRDVVNDPLARIPALAIAWHGPSLAEKETYAVDMLSELLFGGDTGRAYQDLVKGRQLALQISGGLNSERGPSLFQVFAVYRPNVTAADMANAIYQQIDALKQKPPTAEELNRVKIRMRAAKYRGAFGQESVLGRAVALADYTVRQGSPELINTEIDRYMAVTPEQIQAAARRYFTPENRTLVEIRPGQAPSGPPSAPRSSTGGIPSVAAKGEKE